MNLQYSPDVAKKNRLQPTSPQLVWGTRRDRLDYRFQARAAIVEQLVSRWAKPDWRAVDVSGGAGRWLSTLAPHFSQFTHLDLSPNALDVARTDHAEFSNVEYGIVDLLQPREPGADMFARTWDVAFCLDTLLYRGDFVETALRNIHSFVRPGGIVIIDVPTHLRAWISRQVKGRRYGGPERTFSPRSALGLARDTGYVCLATAYQYRELTASTHRFLVERGLTGWVPWPSTWMYLVLRVTEPA